MVCKCSCLIVAHARIGVNEEQVHRTAAQAKLEISFAVPPPVLLPQGHIQLQHKPKPLSPSPSALAIMCAQGVWGGDGRGGGGGGGLGGF